MTDREALLQSILASPKDDLLRLVFADFLEESGEPEQAEYIRVSCAYYAEPICDDLNCFSCETCERMGSLAAAQRAAFDEFGRTLELPVGWVAGILQHRKHADPTPTVYFHRGIAEEAWSPWAAWRDHGDAILARHPVRKVTLTTTPGLVATANSDNMTVDYRLLAGVKEASLLLSYAASFDIIPSAVWRRLLHLLWPSIPEDGWDFSFPSPAVGDIGHGGRVWNGSQWLDLPHVTGNEMSFSMTMDDRELPDPPAAARGRGLPRNSRRHRMPPQPRHGRPR